MPRPYSIDLRGRVIDDVETGASRREAERYGLSPSVVEGFDTHDPLRREAMTATAS